MFQFPSPQHDLHLLFDLPSRTPQEKHGLWKRWGMCPHPRFFAQWPFVESTLSLLLLLLLVVVVVVVFLFKGWMEVNLACLCPTIPWDTPSYVNSLPGSNISVASQAKCSLYVETIPRCTVYPTWNLWDENRNHSQHKKGPRESCGSKETGKTSILSFEKDPLTHAPGMAQGGLFQCSPKHGSNKQTSRDPSILLGKLQIYVVNSYMYFSFF